MDEILESGIWAAKELDSEWKGGTNTTLILTGTFQNAELSIPSNDTSVRLDNDLLTIKTYLKTLSLPSSIPDTQQLHFHKRALQFFIRGNRLWRKEGMGRHQLVIFGQERSRILRETHDQLGHKGFYSTCCTIVDRFWWPLLDKNLQWYLKTCHQCQIRSIKKVVISPTISIPSTLFRKAFTDMMYMPTSHGYSYVVQACCSLSNWPEFRMLRKETGRTLGAFLFEDILCRWGAVEEIIMDNGSPFIAALDWLAQKYHIRHIRISAYNSKANSVVEHFHRSIRDSLIKTCNGDITQWPTLAHHVFWADRVTTQKSTSFSPYYLAHGTEPLLPFDLIEATFMLPDLPALISTTELVSLRARQLLKHDEDLELARERLLKSRIASIKDFERCFARTIKDYSFPPGSLILVLNKKIEAASNAKCKPRYFGPMVVVSRSQGGSYQLAELDGSLSKLKFAAFRIIPYHAHSPTSLEVTQFIDPQALSGIKNEHD